MAFWDDFYDMLPLTITVEAYASEDSSGKPTFSAPVEARAYILDEAKTWPWEDGREIQSKRMVYTPHNVGRKDRLTMPSGFEPRVVFPLWIIHQYDENGFHHSEVYT